MKKNLSLCYDRMVLIWKFVAGEGKDELCCVRFGMVVAVTDVTALANLVRQTGLDIEASALALETMAVMIRKGNSNNLTTRIQMKLNDYEYLMHWIE